MIPLPLPPDEADPETLCRFRGHTCGACCWGHEVSYASLHSQLRRHGRLFRQWFPRAAFPGRLALLGYELSVRGLDLFWALLLLVPGLGVWLRPWLKERLVCAFLGFEEDSERHVGCLLHPTRWKGRDIRPRAAFSLLPGIGCGSPDYLCPSAHSFARTSTEERERFARRVASRDWYAYSRAASTYRPG